MAGPLALDVSDSPKPDALPRQHLSRSPPGASAALDGAAATRSGTSPSPATGPRDLDRDPVDGGVAGHHRDEGPRREPTTSGEDKLIASPPTDWLHPRELRLSPCRRPERAQNDESTLPFTRAITGVPCVGRHGRVCAVLARPANA